MRRLVATSTCRRLCTGDQHNWHLHQYKASLPVQPGQPKIFTLTEAAECMLYHAQRALTMWYGVSFFLFVGIQAIHAWTYALHLMYCNPCRCMVASPRWCCCVISCWHWSLTCLLHAMRHGTAHCSYTHRCGTDAWCRYRRHICEMGCHIYLSSNLPWSLHGHLHVYALCTALRASVVSKAL